MMKSKHSNKKTNTTKSPILNSDIKKTISIEETDQLLSVLKKRFESNMQRHPNLNWTTVQTKLTQSKAALWSLYAMEISGGEPDVVTLEAFKGDILFIDCSKQSPACRRSTCYDEESLNSRKEHKPKNSALSLVDAMGVEILTEEVYRALQEIEEFDTTTSSWIKTPEKIRNLGGALFCDRRYDTVFLYHNGAESYYASRGFRSLLKL